MLLSCYDCSTVGEIASQKTSVVFNFHKNLRIKDSKIRYWDNKHKGKPVLTSI